MVLAKQLLYRSLTVPNMDKMERAGPAPAQDDVGSYVPLVACSWFTFQAPHWHVGILRAVALYTWSFAVSSTPSTMRGTCWTLNKYFAKWVHNMILSDGTRELRCHLYIFPCSFLLQKTGTMKLNCISSRGAPQRNKVLSFQIMSIYLLLKSVYTRPPFSESSVLSQRIAVFIVTHII